jgi:hypothetical protein
MSSRRCVGATLALLSASGCVSPADPPPEPVPVPFTVSDYYSPDGFWGDGATRGSLDVQRVCPEPLLAGAAGDCYAVSYTAGASRFAGVNWQYPHNNWGFDRGRQIAPGATKISFAARGSVGGEVVSFSAGQTGTVNPHNDAFSLSADRLTLTTDWIRHSVLLRGETYNGPDGLIGAFVISMVAPDTNQPMLFYLTDVRWEP